MTTNGADTAVSPDTIEAAFRLAGFQYGTPDSTARQEYQPPDDYDVVIRVFDRPTVVRIANDQPNDLALPYNLAAALIEHITISGYTVTGRQIELESYSVGDITYQYPEADKYKRYIQRAINALRNLGRQKLYEITQAGGNVSPISPNIADNIPLTASEVAFIVSEHANLNTAHHQIPVVPDVSNFVSSVDINTRIASAIANAGVGSGISSSAVDAKIATHTSDDDAHHARPDVSQFVGSSEVATAIQNHSGDADAHHAIPDISGLASSSEVATAIQNHRTDIDAHHDIPDTSQFLSGTAIDAKIASALATGSGLNTAAVNALIGTHTSDSDAHHTIPDTSQFLTGLEINERIDSFSYSKHGIDNRISAAVATHAALPNVHHIPPTSGVTNPIMYRHITSPPMQTGSANPLYDYKVWTDIIPTTSLPETENNTTTSPRHYRVSVKGGLLWDLRYVSSYLIGYRTRLIMRQGSSSFVREQQNDLNSAQGFLTSRDDESDLEYGLDFDTIVQSNANAGRISFAVQIYIQNASTTENAAFARAGFSSAWVSDTDRRVPFIVDATFPVLFVIERLDNLATSL